MDEITKHYKREHITVVWKPNQCIHSTICWKGLAEVFNPRKRPWINMEGAELERIIKQVKNCPSGALSYFEDTEEQKGDKEVDVDTVVEIMPNGPLLVYGNITIKDRDGNETQKHKVTAFCRCGGSSCKPYCDGTHAKNGFRDA
jgi:uncharacterized Fe-S cluster protein YjdI